MIRSAFCALLLLASATILPAQARTFDIASFTPPAEWTAEESGDHVTFTRIDNSAGTFCMFAVYASQAAGIDPTAGFASEWDALVAASFTAPAAPKPVRARTAGGLSFMEGSAAVSRDTASYFADLSVLQAGDRIQSIVVVASTAEVFNSYRSQLTSFLGSFTYGQVPAAAGTQAPTASPTAAPAATVPVAAPKPAPSSRPDLGNIKGKGIVGVWMGLVTVMGSYTPEPRWATFYDDGQVFRDMPEEGLDGFDRSASKADEQRAPYWATYTWDGARGSIIAPGEKYPTVIQPKSSNQIKLDSANYYRCVEVDGLRLQGTWTSFGDPNDPQLGQLPIGKRPVITLSKDGTFVDQGIFTGFLHMTMATANTPEEAAGKGTYEVKRYSLILSYSDGRVKKVALTGLLSESPAPSADIIYLDRSRFNRRK
jgi:hypothetical protein